MELHKPPDKTSTVDCKAFKRRWLMLAIFILIELSNAMSMAEYVSIAEIVAKYYNTTNTVVSWSFLIMVLMYSLFVFPSSYVIHRLGSRKSLLIVIIATSLGSWIKVVGVSPDRFWVVILGQAIVSLVQVLIIPLPARLAGTWFPANEVSTACSIGISSLSISIALGFLLPPFIIDSTDISTIGQSLFGMSVAYAVFPTILIAVAFFGFQERPPLPPTLAQAQALKSRTESQGFVTMAKEIFTNSSFMCLMVGYVINDGIFYALNTLLNQIILKHYPDATIDVGIIGFLINSVGAFGSIVVGALLDKYKRFRVMSWSVNILYIISTILLCFLHDQGIWVLYVVAIIFGFSFSGVVVMGVELGVELTYPAPENVIPAILTAVPCCISLNYLYSYTMNRYNENVAFLIICCIQIFTNSFLFLIKFDLKRQAALKSKVVFDSKMDLHRNELYCLQKNCLLNIK